MEYKGKKFSTSLFVTNPYNFLCGSIVLVYPMNSTTKIISTVRYTPLKLYVYLNFNSKDYNSKFAP